MDGRTPFSETLPRAEKAASGRTEAERTTLSIRSRVRIDDETRAQLRARLTRKLGKYAMQIERVSLRLDDLNGPRGGVDIVCKIKVVLAGLPSIVAEERAPDVREAAVRAGDVVTRAVRRALDRAGRSARARSRSKSPAAAAIQKEDAASRAVPRDDDGSLIGRRVGRSSAQLERALARPEKLRRDVPVDTAAPGVSASDRRVGHGATATRNTKRNRAGMTASLEDSRTTPSRKSTRKSTNRAKGAVALAHNASEQARAPKAQATRARVRKGR
jgi:hypothetical protein